MTKIQKIIIYNKNNEVIFFRRKFSGKNFLKTPFYGKGVPLMNSFLKNLYMGITF